MGSARFTVITPECVRMEYSPSGEFVDAPSLVATACRRGAFVQHVVGDGDPPCEVDAGRVVVSYSPDGTGFSARNLRARIGEIEWRPGTPNAGNLGGTLETLDRVRGQTPLPDGLLSRDGWYLLDDSRTHLLIDGWAATRPAGVLGNTDWYFFGYAKDYRAALKALAAVAGPAPMPRRYALGSWYSRYWPYTSAEYREIVGEFDRRGYPLDVIVMDMDWHKPGWTGWSWNRELLPDAEELLGWFHDNGLAVTLNLHPADGVGPHEDQYGAFMRAIGRDPSTGEMAVFDVGNKVYADALFRCVHEPLEGAVAQRSGPDGDSTRQGDPSPGRSPGSRGDVLSGGDRGPHGVDFWWLDWQQQKFTPSIPELTNLWWLNYLYFQHTSRDGMRGCSFSRWAGWGDHRHPVHFSGDAHTGWESLAFQVPFTAVAGNVGCFYWSHDIGGHFGPRLEEATTRWVQFGALSPVLRLHSARSGALDRLPWTYKEEYERAMHAAFRLRSELFPYIYTMARRCHTEMVGLCRPMYIDWPQEEAAYENPQQYMFGDELLVAPITSPGAGPRKVATQAVWFPPECDTPTSPPRKRRSDSPAHWYNWSTGERYEAGAEQLVAAEIDEIPMFVRGGVPIVTREPTLRMATEPLTKMVIVCYPGEPGSYHEFELYEDDGISDAHERGAYSVTRVRAWWFENELKLDVGIRVGTFPGMVKEREVVLELRGVERATAARIDDRALGAIEGVGGRVRIEGGKPGAEEVVRFTLRFQTTDVERVRKSHWTRRVSGAIECDQEEADNIDVNVEMALMGAGFSLSAGVRTTLWGLVGTGFRRDGEFLHLYGGSDGLMLVDSLGETVVEQTGLGSDHRHDPGRATVRLPRTRVKPKLGLTARRTIVMDTEVVAEHVTDRFILEQTSEPLRSFRVLGPFRYDPTKPMGVQQHGPELIPAKDRLKSTFIDMNASPIAWTEAPPADYWPQSIRKICGGHNGEAMAYALTHVWSPEDQEVTLLLESGDRMELWIGDDKVFSSDDESEVESAVEEVRATLKKGWNQFMAKTNEGGGGWGFRVSIDGRVELKESFGAELPGDE